MIRLSLLLSLAYFIAQPAKADVQLNPTTSARLEFDVGQGTVYLAIWQLPKEQKRVRVSPKGGVREFFEWRGEPFILTTEGKIFALHTSRFRMAAEKITANLTQSAFAIAYILAAAEVATWIYNTHNGLQHMSLEELTHLSINTVLGVVPFTFAVSSIHSLAADYSFLKGWSLGLVRGTNFFTLPVAENVVHVEPFLSDYTIRFLDGAQLRFGSTVNRAARRAECTEWLRRVNTAPLAEVRKAFGI